MKEIWKEIEGYEGLYMISNFGRVKTLNYNHTGKEKILLPQTNSNGYYHISLCKDGVRKTYRIHRLVAIHFISNPNNYNVVNHKDENKKNNNVENLEWCTQYYNTNYGTANSKKSVNKKIKVKQFDLSGKLIKIWDSASDAAKYIGGFQAHISGCCNGKRLTAYGFKWSF